jgi:hypothetical protein
VCVPCAQGLEFIADNKEEQSKALHANVAAVNEELQALMASLTMGARVLLALVSLLPSPALLHNAALTGLCHSIHTPRHTPLPSRQVHGRRG